VEGTPYVVMAKTGTEKKKKNHSRIYSVPSVSGSY
jgi:hypothetical protein